MNVVILVSPPDLGHPAKGLLRTYSSDVSIQLRKSMTAAPSTIEFQISGGSSKWSAS